MKKIFTIAGSNSQKSINKRLLNYSSGLLENVQIIPIDLNDYVLPVYGIDYEDENGIPTAIKRLNELFDKADGFIVTLAEHNGTYTAVFKNTIDWLSRANIKIWRDKPMFLMATSPGGRGGATVLQTAVNYFPYLGGNVVVDFALPNFFDNFSEGRISYAPLREDLIQKIKHFEDHLNTK